MALKILERDTERLGDPADVRRLGLSPRRRAADDVAPADHLRIAVVVGAGEPFGEAELARAVVKGASEQIARSSHAHIVPPMCAQA